MIPVEDNGKFRIILPTSDVADLSNSAKRTVERDKNVKEITKHRIYPEWEKVVLTDNANIEDLKRVMRKINPNAELIDERGNPL